MSLRRIRDHALRKAGAAHGGQIISSVIEYIPVRVSAVREYLVAMDLRCAFLKEQIQAQAANAVWKPGAIQKLLATGIVRADMDEWS
jgi:hypothetical protein